MASTDSTKTHWKKELIGNFRPARGGCLYRNFKVDYSGIYRIGIGLDKLSEQELCSLLEKTYIGK